MQETEQSEHLPQVEGFNPVLAITIIISIAITMVLVTFIVFINSSAYATVKQIDKGQSVVHALDKSDIDTTSPIKPTDIDSFRQSTDDKLRTLDDAADFSANAVSDKQLGL